MSVWNIEFVIEEIRSIERVNSKREVVKNKTVVHLEIDDTDLNIMLKCTDPFKMKFSYEQLFNEDIKNILLDEINEDMLREYYINSSYFNLSDRKAIMKLSYPKINLQ